MDPIPEHGDLPSSQPGVFDRFWWKLHTNTTLLALLLIIVLCVVGAILYRPLFQPVQQTPEFTRDGVSTLLEFVQFTQDQDTYYFAWPENGDGSDIYMVTLSPTSALPVNVTNTPNYAEWWPAPSPVDDRLAFFAVSASGERSLRVMDGSGMIMDATYDVVESGLGTHYQIDLGMPPQWSEDGRWIAFLGRSLDEDHPAVELFVADVSYSKVYRLTQSGNMVIALRWVDRDHLLYVEQRGDQSVALYQVAVSTSPAIPLPLGVLERKP